VRSKKLPVITRLLLPGAGSEVNDASYHRAGEINLILEVIHVVKLTVSQVQHVRDANERVSSDADLRVLRCAFPLLEATALFDAARDLYRLGVRAVSALVLSGVLSPQSAVRER
jgi:hypothetical protein